jgi:hypothetical protein
MLASGTIEEVEQSLAIGTRLQNGDQDPSGLVPLFLVWQSPDILILMRMTSGAAAGRRAIRLDPLVGREEWNAAARRRRRAEPPE